MTYARSTARFRSGCDMAEQVVSAPILTPDGNACDGKEPTLSINDDQQAEPDTESFVEGYTAWVQGQELGNVVLITSNVAGQAQRVVANYRPRDTLLLVSRLVGEHFAGAP